MRRGVAIHPNCDLKWCRSAEEKQFSSLFENENTWRKKDRSIQYNIYQRHLQDGMTCNYRTYCGGLAIFVIEMRSPSWLSGNRRVTEPINMKEMQCMFESLYVYLASLHYFTFYEFVEMLYVDMFNFTLYMYLIWHKLAGLLGGQFLHYHCTVRVSWWEYRVS